MFSRLRKRRRTQRVYIIPTLFGMFSGLVFLIIAVFASATNSSAALVLCAVLLLAGMLAIFQTNITVSKLKIIRIEAEDAPAGKPIPLRVTLLNRSNQGKFMLKIGVANRFWRSHEGATLIESLEAGASCEVLLYLPAKTRGIYEVPTIHVSSTFPLGVCRSWTHLQESRDLVVYPEPLGNDFTTFDPSAVGENGTKAHDDGDFWGHRAYLAGDSLAHVDWKAQARGRGMQTKQYAHGTALSQVIRLTDAEGESLEDQLKQVSLWVHNAYEKDQAFSLVLPRRIVPAGQGLKQYRAAMRALAEA